MPTQVGGKFVPVKREQTPFQYWSADGEMKRKSLGGTHRSTM